MKYTKTSFFKNITVFAILLIVFVSSSFAQNTVQNGIVRKITHSKTDPTLPVQGVKVVVNNISSKASDASGLFSLKINANKNGSFALQDVRIPKNKGYILAYPSLSDKLYLSKNNLVIALITPEEKSQLKKQNYIKLMKEYNKKENELVQLRNHYEELQLEYEESDNRYKETTEKLDSVRNLLNQYYDEKNKKDIRETLQDIANELAITDYQSLDPIEAKIYDLRMSGNWEEIRNIILNKMHGDVEAFVNSKIENKKNAEALLANAKELSNKADIELTKTLKDIETLIETFKMQHMNDSISKYYDLLIKADPDNWEYLNKAGSFENEYMSNYNKAIAYHKAALDYEKEDTLRFITFNNIASVYFNMGRNQECIDNYLKSIEIQKRTFKISNPLIALTYQNIALTYILNNDYNKAEEYLDLAINNLKKCDAKYNYILSEIYSTEATILYKKMLYKESLETFFKSLDILNNSNREDDLGLIKLYINIGAIYDDLGEYTKALDYYNRSLILSKEIYGENHPDIATAYDNVSVVLDKQKKFEEAKKYLLKALDIRLKVFGKQHPTTAISYNNLGGLYNRMGINEDAKKILTKALEIQMKNEGDASLRVATIYANLGNTSSDMGDYDSALKYYNKAMEIRSKIHGKNNLSLGNLYNNIATMYNDMGNFEKSLEYFQKAVDIFIKHLGEYHVNVANVYENMAGICYKYGEHKKSAEFYEKVIDIFEKSEDDYSDFIIMEHISVAQEYMEINDLAMFEKHIGLAIEKNNKKYKECDTNTIKLYNGIAGMYVSCGLHEKAIHFLNLVLECQKKIHGDKHMLVGKCYSNIGMFYSNFLKDNVKGIEYYTKAYEIFKNTLGEDDDLTIKTKDILDKIKTETNK